MFETNSSSSHSLTVSVGDVLQMPFTKEQLRDGVIYVDLGDYNWEWHRYYTPLNKIQYLLTQALLGSGEYGGACVPDGEAAEVTREVCAENERAAMLCEVVKAHTGCDLLFAPGSRGSVDHESVGNGMELFASTAELTQFIFSESSYIQTGNDNSGPGKCISTDRGDEHYYGAHYREAGSDWVTLCVTNEGGLWRGILVAPNGAKLSEECNSEVFQTLREQATVTQASWKTIGPWRHFEYVDPISKAMSEFVRLGLKFSSSLAVSENFTEQDFKSKNPRSTVVTLKLKLPAEVARKVEELPAEKPVKLRKKATKKEA